MADGKKLVWEVIASSFKDPKIDLVVKKRASRAAVPGGWLYMIEDKEATAVVFVPGSSGGTG